MSNYIHETVPTQFVEAKGIRYAYCRFGEAGTVPLLFLEYVGDIAKAVGARALVLNYRRSPEHKFPAQSDDVERAYHWLLAQRIRPENIASIGHSMGGNLAVNLAVTLRDRGAPLPAAILSVSPWYDMEMKNETLESNAETDALLSRPALEMFRESWIGGTGVARNDPRVNMLYADLFGLPPIMVYYGAYEMLVGEAIEFAKRAKDAGLDVSLHFLPEGPAQLHVRCRPCARGGPRRSRRWAGGCDPRSVSPHWRWPSSQVATHTPDAIWDGAPTSPLTRRLSNATRNKLMSSKVDTTSVASATCPKRSRMR